MTERHSYHNNNQITDSPMHPNAHGALPGNASKSRWRFMYWIVGIGSLLWLLLRSGAKPRRLTYPCQRVAALNSAGFLTYLAALLGSAALLRRLKAAFTPGRLALFVVGLMLTVTMQASVTDPVEPILARAPTSPAGLLPLLSRMSLSSPTFPYPSTA